MPRSQSVYRKNFLTDVIVKINFPVILEIAEGSPSTFQKEIQANFPILEPLQQIEFKIENKSINLNQQKSSKMIWKFRNKGSTDFVELDSESLLYNTKKYADYRQFKNTAQTIFDVFFKLYPNTVLTRLGLRYVNQIKLEGTDFFSWTEFIKPELIRNIDFYTDKTKIRRLLTASELAFDDETTFAFKYGVVNSTYPSPVVKKEFVLDYDSYTTIQFETDTLVSKIDNHHRNIKHYFEASITDALRGVLNHE